MSEKVEIKSLTSYVSAFKLMKILVLVVVVAVCGVAGVMTYYANQSIQHLQDSIYVLSPTGEISQAIRSNEGDNRYFEYEAHVEKAYTLWYEIDEGNYKENVDKALYLFGDCGNEMFKDYTEQGMYRKLQSKNMKLFVEVDSIKFDKSGIPVFGAIYGKQHITRPGGELIRHLDCTFNLIDYSRSHENPHGVKIENWEIINADIIE